MSPFGSRMRWALLGAVGAWAGGCSLEAREQETPPTSLTQVQVPSGFKFANSQPVSVTVHVAESLLASGEDGALQVANAQGQLLYRGPVSGGSPARLQLAVATAHSHLTARLQIGSITREGTFPISAGAAALHFE
jgi:hypothetical protein